MKFQQDPLYQIFKRQMDEALMHEESREDEVIGNVVSEYMEVLNKKAMLPPRLYKFIEQDVREDVTAMMKKSTYGYFDLKSYQCSIHQTTLKRRLRDC